MKEWIGFGELRQGDRSRMRAANFEEFSVALNKTVNGKGNNSVRGGRGATVKVDADGVQRSCRI